MTTTIHIPEDILLAIGRKSKQLNISRNKYICMVLQKEVSAEWPNSFRKKRLTSRPNLNDTVDKMMAGVKHTRKNKKEMTF